jgi:di/tricarboxylate transporter
LLVEVAVPPTSFWTGRTVRVLRLGDREELTVLGLHRHPALQRARGDLLAKVGAGDPLSGIELSVGDVLLVSAAPERLRALQDEGNLVVLGNVEFQAPRHRRALLASLLFAVALTAAALRWTSPAIAGMAGLVAMIATGCVDARRAFRIDWRVVLLIGALLALGLAVEKSGAGVVIARSIVPLAHFAGPRGVLALLMFLTVALSVPMSNQAAALVMLPIAVHAASQLGIEPRSFAIGICLAASCSFATPLEPSAALVYGPGGYHFGDYVRVGAPLTALMLVLLTLGVPIFWPFIPAPVGA